ncbi:MAG TPA: bifunctional UDP-N-acetylglucosamine diphosphorylase/glucosamine-1-phosphate N-acetyltransferase GlmU [Acidimicrobiia bacterium]|nr:bifunctional UDP-N-acetylglucosamine diphosphorylase/glucosamine-1-phosphate N-acetyltransferase GlmU [Acidimicrobiia bacterium]
MPAVHAVVLAAGKGTRMRSDSPKVVHRAAGRTLLDWVLEATTAARADRTIVVVGHQADQVAASLPDGYEPVLQEPQNGTGHAVQVALSHLGDLDPDDTILVTYGDMPLVSGRLYETLANRPSGTEAIITTVDPGPPGFGRVLRQPDGAVVGIVEERDCDADQLKISERNVGLYAFAAGPLARAIANLGRDNAQEELYLTDVIAHLVAAGDNVEVRKVDAAEVSGVNSHADLAAVQAVLRRRINRQLMEDGVWMLDPDRTYVDATVTVEPGAFLYPGTHLQGSSAVAAGATVGPDALVVDSVIGAEATVIYSVLRGVEIGQRAAVGPYASLRPGTVLLAGSKAGTFVEMKKTTLGEGAKVPHLAYMGDATIGARANVGAGTITCNYDGYGKYETVIGERAFIGSDTMLVAPVTVGEGAVTGAGSVITEDVPPGSLAVERSQQQEIPGYADRRAARQRAKDAEEGS